MNRRIVLAIGTIILSCMGAATNASAQAIKDKVIGAWTLQSGVETYAGGKTLRPWAAGNLILDPSGHMSLFLIGKDRAKTSENLHSPVGPAVAFYGTYLVDEAAGVINLKIESGVTPAFDGTARAWKVSVEGDTLTAAAPETKAPQGTMTPVNEWKKLK